MGKSFIRRPMASSTALAMAAGETWFIAEQTLSYLVGVIVGRESADQLGGPVRVAEVSAQLSTLGILPLINLTAFLSVSIGLINLFPVPILDGGHLMYYLIELVKGSPVSEAFEIAAQKVGIAAIALLMGIAFYNDIIGC